MCTFRPQPSCTDDSDQKPNNSELHSVTCTECTHTHAHTERCDNSDNIHIDFQRINEWITHNINSLKTRFVFDMVKFVLFLFLSLIFSCRVCTKFKRVPSTAQFNVFINVFKLQSPSEMCRWEWDSRIRQKLRYKHFCCLIVNTWLLCLALYLVRSLSLPLSSMSLWYTPRSNNEMAYDMQSIKYFTCRSFLVSVCVCARVHARIECTFLTTGHALICVHFNASDYAIFPHLDCGFL